MPDFVPILPQPIQPTPKQPGKTGKDAQIPEKSFQDVLSEYVARTNQMKLDAQKAVDDVATGKAENVSEVMVQVKKADLAFKTLMQIRNKILDAYTEISRMRV